MLNTQLRNRRVGQLLLKAAGLRGELAIVEDLVASCCCFRAQHRSLVLQTNELLASLTQTTFASSGENNR